MEERVEELGSGGPGPRRSSGPWWLVALVALVVGGWFLLPDQKSTPVLPVPSSSPAPSPTGGYQPGFHEARPTIEEVCAPRTDGSTRLTLRFVLINRTGDDLVIDDVRPVTPLPGLQLRSTKIVPGGCQAFMGGTLTAPLDSGSEALAVFHFSLPKECPQPLPVGVVVTSHARGIPRSATSTQLPLYPDLGTIDFDTCP